jgi:nucleotide-binding universal stress UspA family protein
MFRRIIVAFDGSERAQDALALALRLRDGDGVITLACTVTERPWHRAEPDAVALTLAAGRAQIPAGIHVRLRAPVASSPARGLTELAEAEHSDLVVVGSSRRSVSGRIWLERTAGRLLQGAPCAVAVPPAGLRESERFRHVAIAYDGSPEARSALAAGYAIAAGAGAAVSLMYVLPPMAPELENAVQRERLRAHELLDEAAEAAPAGVNPLTVLLHGVPGRAIADACDGVVDLLVTGSRGYGPVQRALMGSVAEDVMDGASQPVLVVPRAVVVAEREAEPTGTVVEA